MHKINLDCDVCYFGRLVIGEYEYGKKSCGKHTILLDKNANHSIIPY